MKVKKTDLPVMPPEDILPSLDDEADESDMDDGKLKTKVFHAFFRFVWFCFVCRAQSAKEQTRWANKRFDTVFLLFYVRINLLATVLYMQCEIPSDFN